MSQKEKILVTYTTRVILKLPDKKSYQIQAITPQSVREIGKDIVKRTDRVAEMMELLGSYGFALKGTNRFIYADSQDVDAQETKRILTKQGFLDTEFQIFLEYTRKWGML